MSVERKRGDKDGGRAGEVCFVFLSEMLRRPFNVSFHCLTKPFSVWRMKEYNFLF